MDKKLDQVVVETEVLQNGGALNVASDLSLTAAPVTFMGTTGKLVLLP